MTKLNYYETPEGKKYPMINPQAYVPWVHCSWVACGYEAQWPWRYCWKHKDPSKRTLFLTHEGAREAGLNLDEMIDFREKNRNSPKLSARLRKLLMGRVSTVNVKDRL